MKIKKISAREKQSKYWQWLFERQQQNDRILWNANQMEIEAALLDQANNKYVAFDEDKIVGAISFNMEECTSHIEHLGIIKKGIGNKLMKLAELKSKKVTLVPSKVALDFYTKRGYKKHIDSDLYELKRASKGAFISNPYWETDDFIMCIHCAKY